MGARGGAARNLPANCGECSQLAELLHILLMMLPSGVFAELKEAFR